jgi:hypothetical protein
VVIKLSHFFFARPTLPSIHVKYFTVKDRNAIAD